jgi:hypothetical protein
MVCDYDAMSSGFVQIEKTTVCVVSRVCLLDSAKVRRQYVVNVWRLLDLAKVRRHGVVLMW